MVPAFLASSQVVIDPEAIGPPGAASRDRATKKGGNGRSTAPGATSRRRSIGGADTLRALYEVAVAAAQGADPSELARLAVDHARDLLRVDGAVVFVWDDVTGLLQPLQETASDSEEPPVRPGEGAIGIAFARGEAVIIPDYQAWVGAIPDSAKRGMVSAVAVPMRIGDRNAGALGVWTYKPRRFSAADVRLLSLFGSHIAPALEAARRNSEIEARERTLATLQQVSQEAGAGRRPTELAELVVARARALLRMEGAEVYWERAGRLQLLAIDSSRGEGDRPEVAVEDAGAVGAAFRRRRPVIISDYQRWPDGIVESRLRGIASCLAVPLITGDQPRGALAVWTYRPHEFGPDEVQLLALFGGQVAPAIAAAQLNTSLAESEGRYRSLHQTMAGGLLLQGADGVIVDANKAAEEMLGATVAEMRGHPSGEFWRVFREDGTEVPRDERPAVRALLTGRPVRGAVLQIERRNGERVWVRADAVPVDSPDGSAPLVVSTIMDITAERRAEDALRESERRFRTIFDHAAIGILRLDLRARIREVNPALLRMVGRPAEELLGRDIGELMLAEDRQPKLYSQLARGEIESFQAEMRMRSGQGALVWTNATASLVRDAENRPAFVVAMVEDISTRKAQEAALAHQALHDSLTDLPNRVLLHDRLHQAIRFAIRNRRRAALLLMDLDGFKEINDTFGHHAGDALLRQVSRRLREVLRASDTVARLGGDEFAIVLPNLQDAGATAQTARKILAALENPFTIEGERLNISASIGIAIYPDHGEDAETLLRRGDVAMYVAKRSGSGLSVYSPAEDRHSPARLSLVTGLREAIRDRGLVMHYQPKVRLEDGGIVGLEALARWRHPELGVIAPDEFIPLAEQAGLIRALGAWALTEVVEQLRRWRTVGVQTRVAVNISALQLRDPDLPENLEVLFRRHRLDPSTLMLEITESSVMEDPERAIDILRRLTATGVRVSIDDFGTGYSSLAYLRRLPACELKIDRSLVSDVTRSEGDAVIVRSTIDLGHNLGMEVVAEGVESAETRRLLTEYGCDLAQGYLFSRPLTARAAALRVRRRAPLGS